MEREDVFPPPWNKHERQGTFGTQQTRLEQDKCGTPSPKQPTDNSHVLQRDESKGTMDKGHFLRGSSLPSLLG